MFRVTDTPSYRYRGKAVFRQTFDEIIIGLSSVFGRSHIQDHEFIDSSHGVYLCSLKGVTNNSIRRKAFTLNKLTSLIQDRWYYSFR
jgi:hypothetical protein